MGGNEKEEQGSEEENTVKKRGRRRNMLSNSPLPFPTAPLVDNSLTLVLASWTIEVHCQRKWRFLGISASHTKRQGSLKVGLQIASSLLNEVSTPEGPSPQQMMDNTNIQWPLVCHKTSSWKHILQPNWSAHPIPKVCVVFIILLTNVIQWTRCRVRRRQGHFSVSLYEDTGIGKSCWYFSTQAFTGFHWIWNVIRQWWSSLFAL